MNRIQFWVLTGLSSLVVLLLISHILLVRAVNDTQNQVNIAQQKVTLGQTAQSMVRQLGERINADAEKNHDQKLKDILKRQGFEVQAPSSASSSNDTTSAAPAPATH